MFLGPRHCHSLRPSLSFVSVQIAATVSVCLSCASASSANRAVQGAASGAEVRLGPPAPSEDSEAPASMIATAGPGWLGVGMSKDLRGVRLGHIVHGAPSDKAGLSDGDVVTHLDGEPVQEPAMLRQRIAMLGAGKRIRLSIVRGSGGVEAQILQLQATLRSRPEEREVLEMELLGREAPNLTGAVGIQGAATDLASLRGRVVLVDFFATWCGPCQITIPFLSALYKRYHAQGLDVLGVSTEEEERIASFSALRSIPYGVARDGLGLSSRNYGVASLPTMVLLDKAGVIRKVYLGVPDARDVEAEVVRLLSSASPP
jgi:cytochrome c biogenesis protein CcmG, thiol:disulfide interchange protein DsbE